MRSGFAALTPTERQELAELEAVARRGKQAVTNAGLALAAIRDRGLYRETHSRFEDYCREVLDWAWSPARYISRVVQRSSAAPEDTGTHEVALADDAAAHCHHRQPTVGWRVTRADLDAARPVLALLARHRDLEEIGKVALLLGFVVDPALVGTQRRLAERMDLSEQRISQMLKPFKREGLAAPVNQDIPAANT